MSHQKYRGIARYGATKSQTIAATPWPRTSQLQSRKPHKPQNRPKIPARHTNSPYGWRSKKYPENTRENTPKNTNFVFLGYSGGYLKGYFGSLMFCTFGGISALRWLSYSAAGRGVVKLHPTSFYKNGRLQSKDRPWRVISGKLASEAYRAIGGIA